MNSHPESSYQDDETVDDNLTSNLLRGSQTTARENGRLSLGSCNFSCKKFMPN